MTEQAEISHLVVHHSASPRSVKPGTIRQWHIEKGWDDVGYHYLEDGQGNFSWGRDPWVVGAHVGGKNTGKLGLCIIGNNSSEDDDDHWTDTQLAQARLFLKAIQWVYPSIALVGHNELADTLCPGVDNVRELLL